MPEKFSNLPCLLLYENQTENPPTAILTWKRKHTIVFSWTNFTDLFDNTYEDISLNELIEIITNYLISIEGDYYGNNNIM